MKKLTEKESTDNFITDILQKYSEFKVTQNEDLVNVLHEWSVRIISKRCPDLERTGLREAVNPVAFIKDHIDNKALDDESVKSAICVLATTTLILNQPQKESLLNLLDFRLLFDLGRHADFLESHEAEVKAEVEEFVAMKGEAFRCYDVYTRLSKEGNLSHDSWATEIEKIGLLIVNSSDIRGMNIHFGNRHRKRDVVANIMCQTSKRMHPEKAYTVTEMINQI